MRYYKADYSRDEFNFNYRLQQLHNQVDGSDLSGLLKIRNALYRLKRKYEQSGQRFLDCEYEIMAINEVIAECREDIKE